MNSEASRSPIRLARPFSPIPVSIFVLLIWWVVAHNSGSGWVQVLGDAVFGMLLIGLLAPALALARLPIDFVSAPGDGAAGMPSIISLRTSARTRITPVAPPGPEMFVGRTATRDEGEVILLPVRRGVYDQIVLEVATAAPFGLQWWRRRITLPLPGPLHVAPRLGQAIPLPSWHDERTGALGRVLLAEAGDARGVRDYQPGDRRRRVHWGASAHAGRLMVREMEEPSAQPVTLKVDLPTDEDTAEQITEKAFATIVALLDRGVPVVLATHETAGDVVAPVANRRDAGRRLARATPGHGPGRVELAP